MTSYSKMLADNVLVPIFYSATKTRLRKIITILLGSLITALVAYRIRNRSMKSLDKNLEENGGDNKDSK